MNIRVACFLCALPLVVAATACTSSPAQPSIAAPGPQQPANNAQISYASQPVTLAVANAISTGSSPLMYTFEVATDAAFANKVFTNPSVSEGGNGQTRVQIGTLDGGADYYWHSRAGTTGVFGTAFKFTIGQKIVINAPTPVGPLNGTTTAGWPTFTVNDAVRSGPAGSLMYKFDVATSASFSPITLTGTVPETPNQTSFTPPLSQPPPGQTALFWRAVAFDPVNMITSPVSAVQGFTYSSPSVAESIALQIGFTLWPATRPPGTTGQAVLGDNWEPKTLYHVPTNTLFQSPTSEMLRLFDLLDRGFDPQGAINWMHGNGYPTAAQWYPPPEKAVIGVAFVYIAARNKVVVHGIWDVVLKSE